MIGQSQMEIHIPIRLEPLTDVKVNLVFCQDAHCFSDIYAKVLAVAQKDGRWLHRLGVTSMAQADRNVLQNWVSAAGEA